MPTFAPPMRIGWLFHIYGWISSNVRNHAVLLLGSGGSGKTTLDKQLRTLSDEIPDIKSTKGLRRNKYRAKGRGNPLKLVTIDVPGQVNKWTKTITAYIQTKKPVMIFMIHGFSLTEEKEVMEHYHLTQQQRTGVTLAETEYKEYGTPFINRGETFYPYYCDSPRGHYNSIEMKYAKLLRKLISNWRDLENDEDFSYIFSSKRGLSGEMEKKINDKRKPRFFIFAVNFADEYMRKGENIGDDSVRNRARQITKPFYRLKKTLHDENIPTTTLPISAKFNLGIRKLKTTVEEAYGLVQNK